jgi:hypothetical protein
LWADQSQTVLAGTGILQESGGIQRNPEESKGIRSNSVEIQEFLSRRNSCKKSCKSGRKQEFSRPLQNHVPVNKFLKKNGNKKSSGILCFSAFSVQKIKQELPT